MSAALENLGKEFLALAQEHGLTYLSIALYTLPDGSKFFGAGAHDEAICASDSMWSGSDASEKIASAIDELTKQRRTSEVRATAAR